jgi:hypothetical protein
VNAGATMQLAHANVAQPRRPKRSLSEPPAGIRPDELVRRASVRAGPDSDVLLKWLIDEELAVTGDDGLLRPTARAIMLGGALEES